MNNWKYLGTEIVKVPEGATDFVYCIRHKQGGPAYIGRKGFWSTRTLPPLSGKLRVRKRKVESNWRDYFGSGVNMTASVLEFGSDAFSREMLHICPMRSAAAYLEAFEQMRQGVFEGPEGRPWTNGIINLRVRRTDRLADWLAEYRRAGRLK